MMALVTCITPITKSRLQFLPKLEKIIQSQDYPYIEHLMLWDDGTIGAKRNALCERAKGEIIIHIDSDDWYASDWVSKQVECLLSKEADICGLSELYFYNSEDHEAWKYVWNKSDGVWIAGATMCYKKSFWQENKFRDIQVGEDNYFVWKQNAKVATNNYVDGFIAMLHGNNTAPHHKTYRWQKCESSLIANIINNS